jgi:prepilin-type N-terminal cleavage/methylation domain-containing protein
MRRTWLASIAPFVAWAWFGVRRSTAPAAEPSPKARRARNARRGASLFELMVGLAILGVILLIVVGGLGWAVRTAMGPSQKTAAEGEARAWAQGIGVKLLGVTCADVDSDNDGYVSCSANVEGQGIVPIECRGAYSAGHGCRAPKPRLGGSMWRR